MWKITTRMTTWTMWAWSWVWSWVYVFTRSLWRISTPSWHWGTVSWTFIDFIPQAILSYLTNTIPSQTTLRTGMTWLIIILTQRSFFNTFTQMLTQLAFVLSILTIFVVYWMNGQRQVRNLPPGPKKYPFIGNLLQMPSTLEWETFAKWGQEYSSWWIKLWSYAFI